MLRTRLAEGAGVARDLFEEVLDDRRLLVEFDDDDAPHSVLREVLVIDDGFINAETPSFLCLQRSNPIAVVGVVNGRTWNRF